MRGFTLVEILTATALFLVIMTISMGSIVGVFEANRKSRTLRTAMNNLNLSVESIAKELRFGRNYYCGTLPSQHNFVTTQDCPNGSSIIGFVSSDNLNMVYKQTGTAIERSINGGSTFLPITAPEMIIGTFNFYVNGSSPIDLFQPKAVVTISGHTGITGKGRTDFVLQTLISQRSLDTGD